MGAKGKRETMREAESPPSNEGKGYGCRSVLHGTVKYATAGFRSAFLLRVSSPFDIGCVYREMLRQ